MNKRLDLVFIGILLMCAFWFGGYVMGGKVNVIGCQGHRIDISWFNRCSDHFGGLHIKYAPGVTEYLTDTDDIEMVVNFQGE